MSQDKIQKARELVLNYIATHSLSDKLNRAVNEVCRSRPKDPWLFLSDIISEWTRDVPIIDRLVAKQGIDCYGNTSLQLQLFGRVANARPPRYLGVENVFIVNNNKDEENKNDIDDDDDDENDDIKSMMKKVSEFLSPALRSIRIDEQIKIDKELLKLYDDGLQEESTKFNIIPTISSLIAITTSNYLRMPLYKYLNKTKKTNSINSIKDDDDNSNYKIPQIMVEITKSSTNKLPSICIVTTNNLRPIQRITMITEIVNELSKIIISTKNRKPSFDENNGSLLLEDTDCLNIEQLLSLINTAISNCKKYEISKDLSLCLSFLNNPTLIQFNSEQKIYKIEGKIYENNTIIDYFAKLLDEYKEIEYLEDPLNELDTETYQLMNNRVSNAVIIGNKLYSSSIQLIENGIKSSLTSAVFVSISEMFTLTNTLNVSNMIQKYNDTKISQILMISDDNNNGCTSSYCVDLTVASNAKILRLSTPNTGKSMNKYNRWLMIADELYKYDDDDDDDNDDDNDNVDVNDDVVNNTKINGARNINGTNNNKTINDQNNNNNINGIGSDADKTEDLP